jgi:hypothetical protein
MAGKGDTPRKVDGDKYRYNYDMIFVTKLESNHEDKQPKTTDETVVEDG